MTSYRTQSSLIKLYALYSFAVLLAESQIKGFLLYKVQSYQETIFSIAFKPDYEFSHCLSPSF